MQNNDEIDKALLREMFNAIRNFEIKNVKLAKYKDQDMSKHIAKYITKKVGDKDEV